MILEDRLFKGS
ncbi:hypothetical protein LINPERHAP1_LOCUS17185 [Linum perenne]